MNDWTKPDVYKMRPYVKDHAHMGLNGGAALRSTLDYFNAQSVRTHYHTPELREKYQYNPDTGLITFRPSPSLRAEQVQRWRALAKNAPYLDFEDFLTNSHLTMRPTKKKTVADYSSVHQFRVHITLGPSRGYRAIQRLRYGWLAFMLMHPEAPPSLPMEVGLRTQRGSDGTYYSQIDNPALYWWDNLDFRLSSYHLEMEQDAREGRYMQYRERKVSMDTGAFLGYAEHYDNDYGKWLGMLK